ncbi:MAG: hypothetical protein HY700_07035 [Gemmatimonadetes bacterium]|nr:hypothetical protein [Gemmatimonadota bacterium]
MLRSRLALFLLLLAVACSRPGPSRTRFEITFDESVRREPITGRVLLMISRDSTPEPRLQAGAWERSVPFFGTDAENWRAGDRIVIDGSTIGYPVEALGEIPAGDYHVQALANIYTEFRRSDGHVLWLHEDQWEGQHFNRSPGNLISEVHKVHLDPRSSYRVRLTLSRALPPVEIPADDQWVKRIKFQSDLLTKFWGRPIYLGAVVLLPKDYDRHPNIRYPVVYQQGHFSLGAPFGFTTDSATPETDEQRRVRLGHNRETRYEFSRKWMGPGFPRFIAVTFQHPTPYYDDSYAVNSANNGPYGDAIMTELIPRVEREFRIIRQPHARVLTGGSTGGWEALALQIYHPDFFGGTWPMYPDPIEFSRYGTVNIYSDTNAFVAEPHHEWIVPERFWMRDHWMHGEWIGQPTITMRAMSRFEEVLGSRNRSAEQLEVWEAVYGPVGKDGYPRPLWDKRTGTIDREVASYMRENGYDLVEYLRRNWPAIGPKLAGKLHVSVGESDEFWLNLAVYKLEEFLATAKPPCGGCTIEYGRPMKSHGWQPKPTTALLRDMADQIGKHAPAGENTRAWRY